MRVEPGSRLHDALGADEVEVNSFHHQAIERLAPGLRATGVAPDGVIEVIEADDREHYVLAAQFELQEEWRVDPRFLDIFRRFVAAATGSE
jgi:putative glutamine amidotransferase